VIIFSNSNNQFIFVMGKNCIFFAVWTEFVNVRFSFKGLMKGHATKISTIFKLDMFVSSVVQ
jgi:hypothetical protein